MPRNHCSQCRQEGHNKRNRNCPVNVRQKIFQLVWNSTTFNQCIVMPESRERANLCKSLLLNAIIEYIDLYNLVSRPVSSSEFVIGVFNKTNSFCDKMNLALESDFPDTPLISPILLFESFTSQINLFNTFISSIIASSIDISTSFEDNRFDWTLVNPTPTATAKKTSAYLKEMSFVHLLTIDEDAPSCDCAICFDEISALSSIVTNCNHSFCEICIQGFTNANKDKTNKLNCPLCRTDLTEFKIGNQQVLNNIREHILNL